MSKCFDGGGGGALGESMGDSTTFYKNVILTDNVLDRYIFDVVNNSQVWSINIKWYFLQMYNYFGIISLWT